MPADDEQMPLLKAPYTVFSERKKLFIILTATAASIFSPLSANIYYPALNAIHQELHIPVTLLNTTITSYMIFQGLSPTFVASLSDTIGRRPIYIFCFLTYIIANLSLSMQRSYIGLLLLRCLQSIGSSSTVNLAYGVTADLVTSAERGRYIGLASVGPIIGPSIGPVVGGVIARYLGWPYIFVVLAAAAAVFFVFLLCFLPETCRAVVGDGSVAPRHWWHQPLVALLRREKRQQEEQEEEDPESATSDIEQVNSRTPLKPPSATTVTTTPLPSPPPKPNPLTSTFTTLLTHPTGPIILFNGLTFSVHYTLTSSLPHLFSQTYSFNALQLGASYLPLGLGTLLAALGNGHLLDALFRRHQARHPHQNPHYIHARLPLLLPALLLALLALLTYAGSLAARLPPAAPLAALFVFGAAGTAAYAGMNVLVVDLNPGRAATASAASNLVRCVLGALAAGGVMPLVGWLGVGWGFGVVAGVWVGVGVLVGWWVV